MTNLTPDPHQQVAEPEAMPARDDVMWCHAAFCRVALPLRGQKTPWQRDVQHASVRIEPGGLGLALPAGPVLRLLLLHVCDAAHRSGNPVVELGETAAALAARLGVPAKAAALAEQLQRILAAKISVSVDGEVEHAVLDARGRPRTAESPWRPSLRLTRSFSASLDGHAVPLDRRVIAALWESPAALDAYAWIRQALHGRKPGETVEATWDELRQAFGTASQDGDAFRPAFEAVLRTVQQSDATIGVTLAGRGVTLRREAPSAHDAADVTARGAADAAVSPDPALAGSLATEAAPSPGQTLEPAPPEPAAAPPPAASAPAPVAGDEPQPAPPESHPAEEPPQPAVTRPPVSALPETISLRTHLTGLRQVIWLRRGYGADSALVGVTPSERFDADRLTLLTVEPMVMQVSGGLSQQDFDRVSSWVMANRELIDDIWAGQIAVFDEIERRVTKVPAPGWR